MNSEKLGEARGENGNGATQNGNGVGNAKEEVGDEDESDQASVVGSVGNVQRKFTPRKDRVVRRTVDRLAITRRDSEIPQRS
jgi:hypothetical protein